MSEFELSEIAKQFEERFHEIAVSGDLCADRCLPAILALECLSLPTVHLSAADEDALGTAIAEFDSQDSDLRSARFQILSRECAELSKVNDGATFFKEGSQKWLLMMGFDRSGGIGDLIEEYLSMHILAAGAAPEDASIVCQHHMCGFVSPFGRTLLSNGDNWVPILQRTNSETLRTAGSRVVEFYDWLQKQLGWIWSR